MQTNELKKLKKWSKDEQSFEKMKEFVKDLIDERDQKKQDLQLLESAIKSDYDSILITELDLEEPGPKIVYVNEGFCEMTGYSKEEVIGKTPRILQGPKTDRKVLDKLKQRLSQGKSFFGQAVNYRKDGSEFINQWDIHPLTDSEGNITHWVSYQHDITKRKKAEEYLVDQKLEFDELRKEAKRTVVDVDVQGNIVMANKAFRQLTGYSKDELKKVKIWDLFSEKYRSSLKSRFDSPDVESHFEAEEFEGFILRKEGPPIQIKGNTQILDLKDQKIIRIEIENISMRKRIMATLEDRNYSYERIVSKASEYTYSVEFDGEEFVITAVSEEFPEITEFSDEAVLGKDNLDKFINEEDLQKFQKHLLKIKQGKSSTCEYRLRTKEGEFIPVLDFGKPEWQGKQDQVVAARCAVTVDVAYTKLRQA
jgi:PAS domain S-box-containing protein